MMPSVLTPLDVVTVGFQPTERFVGYAHGFDGDAGALGLKAPMNPGAARMVSPLAAISWRSRLRSTKAGSFAAEASVDPIPATPLLPLFAAAMPNPAPPMMSPYFAAYRSDALYEEKLSLPPWARYTNR